MTFNSRPPEGGETLRGDESPSQSSFAIPFMMLAVALGIAIRVAQALRTPIIETDGAFYVGLASAILRGDWAHGVSPLWPPLYPLLIAGTAWVPLVLHVALTPAILEACARSVSIACGIAMLIPLYRLASRLIGHRGAQWALLFALFHPRLVQYSASALSEMAFTFMMLVGVAVLMAGWRAEPESSGSAASRPFVSSSMRSFLLQVAAGVAFGLAYLVRPEGILIAMLLWVAGFVVQRRQGATARLSLPLLMSVVVVSAPFIMFLHAELGTWSLGEKGPYNFWRQYRSEYATLYPEPKRLAERGSESPELAASIPAEPVHVAGFIIHRPGVFFARYLRNLAHIVLSSFPIAVYHIFVLLALVGVMGCSVRRWWAVLTVIVFFPLLYAAFSIDRRFFVPAIPLVILLSARGAIVIESWFNRRARLGTKARWVTHGVAAVLVIAGVVYSTTHGGGESASEHRAAGEWLGAHWRSQMASGESPTPLHARPIVMSRKLWVAYYAGGLIAGLPEGSIDDVLAQIRRKRCDVLVIDESWTVSIRPQLKPLLDPALAPQELRCFYQTNAPRRILLYDVSAVR